MSKIRFFSEGSPPGIRFSKSSFRKLAGQIFSDHGKEVGYVNIIFCDDEYLLDVNKSHLNHDYYTDIITFDYNKDTVESDIFISTDRVSDNAGQVGVSPSEELYRVMIHGCIHLCGFGDKTKEETAVMRSKEDQYLALLNI